MTMNGTTEVNHREGDGEKVLEALMNGWKEIIIWEGKNEYV